MSDINPATPAAPVAPATPGSTTSVIATPSTATPPVVPEGKVTISTKEFAQLSRDAARGRSAQKRNDFNRRGLPPKIDATANPDANQAIVEAEERAADAERRALQGEIRVEVSKILEKDEFKPLPTSTKNLILKNPGILTTADNLEEALLDIEEFAREETAKIDVSTIGAPKPAQPDGHEVPPVVTPGAPAPIPAADLEDTSKLTGAARSTATIRNLLKKAPGPKA